MGQTSQIETIFADRSIQVSNLENTKHCSLASVQGLRRTVTVFTSNQIILTHYKAILGETDSCTFILIVLLGQLAMYPN